MAIHSISSDINTHLSLKYTQVREQSVRICSPLQIEDYVAQPIQDVSPPKWHLGHMTWFFEKFLLLPFSKDYKVFNPDYHYLFNSYYISAGVRWTRAHRGVLTRPTVKEVLEYRRHVDDAVVAFLEGGELNDEVEKVVIIGLNHEQQHQELLLYDIKYILGNNPLLPPYSIEQRRSVHREVEDMDWLPVDEGVYRVGFDNHGFCFDNERGAHKVFLHEFEIADRLILNGEYLEFIKAGGYSSHQYWLSEGWDWVKREQVNAPLYWMKENDLWYHYTFAGLMPLELYEPVSHVSYYEADAFARWRGHRLPTEFEWEVAAGIHQPEIHSSANFVESGILAPIADKKPGFFGNLWEWTSSAYSPYPYYQPAEGALGEYNGKFMINQMVLRGGSYATPVSHIRHTYRNFFHPHLRWLFNGIRLARYK